MRALVGFLFFAVAVVAVIVFVVVPYLAGPLLTGVIQSSGILQGGSLTVETKGTGPELITGHADALRVRGQDVAIRGMTIGDADVTLRDVSLFGRTFKAVDGTLRLVRVQVVDGPIVTIAAIDLTGPADSVEANGRLDAKEADTVIREATARVGVRVDAATLGNGSIHLRRGDLMVEAGLTVRNGSLILEPDGGLPSVVLMGSKRTDPWQLEDVTVTPSGLQLNGTLDGREYIDATGAL